jgi:hypothetical protein
MPFKLLIRDSDLRRIVNNSRRRYQRCQTEDRDRLKVIYNQKHIEYKHLINKSKTDSWNAFVLNNTRENPWGLIYSISRQKMKFEKFCEIKAIDGSLITETNY